MVSTDGPGGLRDNFFCMTGGVQGLLYSLGKCEFNKFEFSGKEYGFLIDHAYESCNNFFFSLVLNTNPPSD